LASMSITPMPHIGEPVADLVGLAEVF